MSFKFWKRVLEKKVVQNEGCYTVMYVLERILSNIYRIFNEKYWVWVFLSLKPATNAYSHEYTLFWVCFGFCFNYV